MSFYIQQVEQLISQGRYLEARNLAEECISNSGENNLRFKQLYALALSKSGAPEVAVDYLLPVYHQHPEDPENAGILGGIYKELFKQNQDSKFAVLSRDTYAKNFEQTKNYYTGINAATMSAIAGKMQKGREVAEQVIQLIDGSTGDFWEVATLAEAKLLNKERTLAIELYFKCKQMAGTDWGKINSVYNQLWLLNHYVPVPAEVMKVFGPPGVTAFVGHMIDHPEKPQPRFPASIEEHVRGELEYTIKSVNAKVGYCSLACGADILFAEAMLEQGAELNIFLPFDKEDFISTSLVFAGEQWVDRFHSIINNKRVIYLTKDKYNGNDALFTLQSRMIFGAAILRSKLLNSKVNLITVLSEMDMKTRTGGTRYTMQLWPYADRVHNINPDKFVSLQQNPEVVAAEPVPVAEQATVKPDTIVSYLCFISFNEMPAASIHEAWQQILADTIDLNLTVNGLSIADGSLTASFNSSHSCIDFVSDLMHKYGFKDIKVSLHAGPAKVDLRGKYKSASLEGTALEVVKEINGFAMPGRMVATDIFASVLALNLDLYQLTHAGIVQLKVYDAKIGIYQVEKTG
ncbi:MAG TPA: TRAFs-binding domain-containing protein [Cyclobacteriaceae bacterium]|nr:TRAFs-binding domain-containing protein [Cyclobacteriaceae bacterium]